MSDQEAFAVVVGLIMTGVCGYVLFLMMTGRGPRE
jgi:hypothetical protein